MTQTVSQAVEQREQSPAATIATYNNIFTDILPAHIKPEAFIRLAQGVLRKDDKLAVAARSDLGSLMAALLDCARLGHEPGTPAYYLVPIKGKVEGWEGYRGVIERIYRAGAVSSVRANLVRANDHYDYDEATMDRPVHRYPRFATAEQRGPLIGVYAYAEMRAGGISRVVEMARDVVMRHKAMSQASDRADSPWQKWEESMWMKCAAHELEKWVPSSTEYRRGELRAAAEAQRIVDAPHAQQPQGETVDYVDGTVVEQPAEQSWPAVTQPPDPS